MTKKRRRMDRKTLQELIKMREQGFILSEMQAALRDTKYSGISVQRISTILCKAGCGFKRRGIKAQEVVTNGSSHSEAPSDFTLEEILISNLPSTTKVKLAQLIINQNNAQ